LWAPAFSNPPTAQPAEYQSTYFDYTAFSQPQYAYPYQPQSPSYQYPYQVQYQYQDPLAEEMEAASYIGADVQFGLSSFEDGGYASAQEADVATYNPGYEEVDPATFVL